MLPKEGSALLWMNLKSSGYRDEQQNHGGCPVAAGKKFIITKWFYNYFQYKKFPCETKHDMSLSMQNKLNFIPYNISSSHVPIGPTKKRCWKRMKILFFTNSVDTKRNIKLIYRWMITFKQHARNIYEMRFSSICVWGVIGKGTKICWSII